MTDQDFANIFAMAQSIPGPNMILMMSFVGWKVWGFPGAVASAFATFGPACTIYFASYRLWDRFRDAPWQQIVRLGLVPVVMGLVIAGGTVMARAADTSWPAQHGGQLECPKTPATRSYGPSRSWSAHGSIRLVDRQYDHAVAAEADPLRCWYL
jgi:hypothetical protein